jgi:two-component system chemotaxis response regulator CheB
MTVLYCKESTMPGHGIIVIGTSAGGVEALSQLVASFPSNLPAAIFIVLHVPSQGTSVLPRILNRAGVLPCMHPIDGQAIENGHIYIAPPDQHLLVKRGYIQLTHGPRENGHRPAVDPLFRSAARAYGPHVIGVILSGVLDDGTAGMVAVQMRNGICVVQDPLDAVYTGMPQSAIDNVKIDHIVALAQMGDLLVRLVENPVPDKAVNVETDFIEMETDMAELEENAMHEEDHPGRPSVYGCPECGGTLWEIQEGELTRYRCRIGHAYSAQTLLSEQSEALEEALWIALRALEENVSLSKRMAQRAQEHGSKHSAKQFNEQAEAAHERAEIVRRALKYGTLTMNTGVTPDGKHTPVSPTGAEQL